MQLIVWIKQMLSERETDRGRIACGAIRSAA